MSFTGKSMNWDWHPESQQSEATGFFRVKARSRAIRLSGSGSAWYFPE